MITYHDNVTCLADYIESVLQKFADRPAYTALGQTLTFAEIDRKSSALARYFVHEAKLSPGTKVAIQLPNLIQNPIVVYAALRAGLVVVNTNPLYTEREMKHQFTDSGAKALVILGDLLPKFTSIKDDTSIETVITTSATELLDPNTAPNLEGAVSFTHAVELGNTLPAFERPSIALDELS